MKSTIYIIVAIFVVIGVGAYLLTDLGKTSESTNQGDSAMTEENTSQDGGDFSGSMEELVARGGNYRCTFSHQSDTDDSSGTIYISGSSIRGDFVSLIQRINVESHMIQSGGYIYTWSSTMPTGFKLKVATTTEAGGTAIPGQYSDVDQTYSYDCESWSPDNSKFSIPSTITFKELGQ